MKRSTVFAAVLVLLMTSSCFAIGAGIGIRAMGMGGCGIATANDITAAYFNPAGLMYGPENFELSTYAGGATQGLTALVEATSDPEKFIGDQFENDFSFGGTVAGGFGLSVQKVGISVIADGIVNFRKPANALSFGFNGNLNAMIPLTLGSTFNTPGLPIASMSVGVNLKSINLASVITDVTQTGVTGSGTTTTMAGSGFGFDIGAQAKVTPLLSLGAVVRNLSASTAVIKKTDSITVSSSGTVTTVAGPEQKTTYNLPPEVGVGAGLAIPLTGTLVAVDLENYSTLDPDHPSKSESYTDTHIGIEQGILMNVVMLRLGYFTYSPNSDSFYTYGLGLNLGPCNIGIAAANSAKDSKNSASMAQVGVAF